MQVLEFLKNEKKNQQEREDIIESQGNQLRAAADEIERLRDLHAGMEDEIARKEEELDRKEEEVNFLKKNSSEKSTTELRFFLASQAEFSKKLRFFPFFSS